VKVGGDHRWPGSGRGMCRLGVERVRGQNPLISNRKRKKSSSRRPSRGRGQGVGGGQKAGCSGEQKIAVARTRRGTSREMEFHWDKLDRR